LTFPRNSTGRQIGTETTRELKLSQFVKKVYLYKATEDGDDRVVIAIARERQSSGFVPKSKKAKKWRFLQIQPSPYPGGNN